MIFWLFIGQAELHRVIAHPLAHAQRGIAENHTLGIGVNRCPRRRRKTMRPNEQAVIFFVNRLLILLQPGVFHELKRLACSRLPKLPRVFPVGGKPGKRGLSFFGSRVSVENRSQNSSGLSHAFGIFSHVDPFCESGSTKRRGCARKRSYNCVLLYPPGRDCRPR